MKRITSLIRFVFATALLLTCVGKASAAYPTKDDLKDKTYVFKGTLTPVSSDSKVSALKEEFEFKFIDPYGYNNITVSNFIVSANLGFMMDNAGKITFTNKNGVIPGTSGQVYFAFAGNKFSDDYTWQVDENSNITIPDFEVRDYISDNPIATYTDITVTKFGEGEDEGDKATYPSLADLLGKTYTFTGSLERVGNTTADDARFAALKESYDFTVGDYGMLTNLILANTTYSYNETTGELRLSGRGAVLGTTGNNNYLAPNDLPNDQSTVPFIIQVNTDGSFTFPDFTVRDFTSDRIYAKYTNAKASTEGEGGGGDEETSKFPAAGAFDGWYKYTCSDFQNLDPSYGFTDEITFQIFTSDAGTTSVKGFLMESVNCDYNETTGELTLNSYYFKNGTTNVGIAPEGNWGGMGFTANKMVWKIAEDGTITIPAFDLVTFTGANVNNTLAKYGTGTVEKTTEPEPEPEPGLDFTGFVNTYTFHGLKKDHFVENFSGFTTEDNETENYNLTFTINQYGQIEEFDGYKLDPQKVGNFLNNRGTVEGNVYTLEMQTFTGIEWDYGDGTGESGGYTKLFSCPDGSKWEQDKVAFTLTKNDDGTFTLSDLSIALKYSYKADGDDNAMTYYATLTSYSGMEYGEYIAPDMTGIDKIVGEWEIPLADNYIGVLDTFNQKFEVSLDGLTVTFKAMEEGKEGDYHMIGKFIDKETIEFDKAVVGPTAKYSLKAVPFINTAEKLTGTTDEVLAALIYEYYTPIQAKFDQEELTLTFPEKSGMAYAHLDDEYTQPGSSWNAGGYFDTAYDFNGIGHKVGEVEARFTIVNQIPELSGNSINVYVEVETENFEFSDAETWTVNLTEIVDETNYPSTLEASVVSDGTLFFTIADLTNGIHQFQYTLTAKDSEGKEIATSSNGKAITYEVGPSIAIRSNGEVLVDKGNITVSFTHTISGIDLDEVTFKAHFTDHKTITDENPEGTFVPVEATLNHFEGTGTATLTVNANARYNHYVTLAAYDNNGNVLAESNRLDISSEVTDANTSGIEDLINDNNGATRYFNLQGVEVKNPQSGTVVIKVSDNKAEKVLVK